MSDTASIFMGITALYLDATGGLTHRRLREAAGVTGVLSGGRISALLMRMQMIGYVYAARDHAAGTPKVYRPTPKMTATFRAHYRRELEAIELMSPGADGILDRYDTPDGFRAFMAAYGEMLKGAARMARADGETTLEISARRSGGLFLFALLVAAADAAGRFPATGRAALSITALSRRFRVSRAHGTALMREMLQAGYITRGAAEGESEVQPPMVEDLERSMAALFLGIAACASRSLARPASVAAA